MEIVVNRKSLSAEFLQKVSAETLSVSAETNLSVSVIRQKATISAEKSSFCRKELFLPKFGKKISSILAERGSNFCRNTLFLQKEAVSAEIGG